MSTEDEYGRIQRWSDAAAIYRYQGDTASALKIEAVLSRIDADRPVRVADLAAAEELVTALDGAA